MIFHGIRKLWKPELFQGRLNKKGYFEGWYFKFADAAEKRLYAVIPGVSLDKEGKDPHCFIQFLDSSTGQGYFFRYGIETFSYSKDRPEIKVGTSTFSLTGLDLDINDGETMIKGRLGFDGLHPWPIKPFSPGAMGWYAFMPFMQCYHGVLSFNHRVSGSLTVNGESTGFDNGKGYIEKDWGTSFPGYHVWLQSNHFADPGISIMASVANIPWLGNYFDGFLIGVLYQEKVYRFTTYTGAKIDRFSITEAGLTMTVTSIKYELELEVSRGQSAELRTPVIGQMEGRLSESLSAEIQVTLYEKTKGGKKLVFKDTGRHAGLEIEGDLPRKLKQ